VKYLSFQDQLSNGPRHFLDGDTGIDTMLKKEVDPINAEPLQAAIASLANSPRTAIQAGKSAGSGIQGKAKFRGDHDMIANDT
jgi:hypothetical protein